MAWFDNYDNETRAYIANKGWDKLGGDELIGQVFKSYQSLERSRPDPARTLTIPEPSDTAGQLAFYQRLGMPKDPTGYTFEGIDQNDSDLIDFARSLATELHLTVDQATKMASKMLEWGADQQRLDGEETTARIAAQTQKLKDEWKDDYEARTATATNAFEALKMPKETVDALINQIGVDAVMKLGHDLGSRMGEKAPLIGGGTLENTPKTPAMTRDQALVERNRLMNDPEFGQKAITGDKEALQTLADLAKAIVGTPDNWSAPPPNFGRTRENPIGDPNYQPGSNR